ncbi:hypothetical protein BKA93DRAFT_753695 [Sparassis latifolia]
MVGNIIAEVKVVIRDVRDVSMWIWVLVFIVFGIIPVDIYERRIRNTDAVSGEEIHKNGAAEVWTGIVDDNRKLGVGRVQVETGWLPACRTIDVTEGCDVGNNGMRFSHNSSEVDGIVDKLVEKVVIEIEEFVMCSKNGEKVKMLADL